MADGILNLLKPPGLTSHDAVQEVRRLFGERRVGHAGTLDPGAAGVLVVCVGEGTKAVPFMEEHHKEYWGEAVLGFATFTQDAGGAVTAVAPDGWETHASRLAEEAARLTGEVDQAVPLVSAVHVKGERLYRLARRGVEAERPVRRVSIEQFSIEEVLPNAAGRVGKGARVRFRVRCSPGTYVRALVDEFGRGLGGGAYLRFLLRTASGPFRLNDACTLEELAADRDPAGRLQPVDAGIPYPKLRISREEAFRFVHGGVVGVQETRPGRWRVYGVLERGADDGVFLGVGEVDRAGLLRPRRLFGQEEGKLQR